MANRRTFLKMLGAATVGTVAHEQLSWLVRQPVSVINNLYPYRAEVMLTGMQPGSHITLMRPDGSWLYDWDHVTESGLKIAADVTHEFVTSHIVKLSVPVNGPEDRQLTLREQNYAVPDPEADAAKALVTTHIRSDDMERGQRLHYGKVEEWVGFLKTSVDQRH